MKKKVILVFFIAMCVFLLGQHAGAFAEEPSAAAVPSVSDADLIYFGVYKDEPVLWRVLDASETNTGEKGIFLLTDGLIDKEQVPFDESSTLWEGSLAQQWCTDFFQMAFNRYEQELIPATSKDEDEVYLYALSWRAVSLKEEHVFFLSVIELEKYFGSYSEINKETVEKSSLDSYWWLRSPHRYHDDYHGIVLQGSYIHDYLPYAKWSARPCINLLLQNACFLLPADDNGELGEVVFPGSDGKHEWRLLVSRADHPFRTESVTSSDNVLQIRYSGADTGNSSSLSLIVSGSEGEAPRFIRLEHPSTADGILSLSLDEWGLTDQNQLFLICETSSVRHLTSIASMPIELIVDEAPAGNSEVTPSEAHSVGSDGNTTASHEVPDIASAVPDEAEDLSGRRAVIMVSSTFAFAAAAAVLIRRSRKKRQ